MTKEKLFNVKKARQWAYNYFMEKKSSCEIKEIDYLLSFVLNWDRTRIYTYPEHELSLKEEEKFKYLVQKRTEGIPFNYLTKKKEFMGLEFYVNENVLIPRPETEILVEEAAKWVSYFKEKYDSSISILEPCTGTGIISLSLARLTSGVKIHAGELSEKALEVAKINMKNLNINQTNNEVIFYQGDLFCPFPRERKFHLILANPPYIPSGKFKELSHEVNNEPKLALDGGYSGLEYYYKIKKEFKNYLLPGGIMLLEIGEDQKNHVLDLFSSNYVETWTVKDLKGYHRVLGLKLNK